MAENNKAQERVLMKGNEVLAEAAMRAGCRFFFGYPITPQTELAAYMAKRMPKEGGTYLQAESEVAAINMVYGASAAGARVMTSSSSPGVSLKSEGVSYIAGADLPCLIINIERGGPGLGSIQPSQSDYWQATRALGHGDFQMVVYAPSTVQEMADLAYSAFDIADKYRTPVMILGDGMLGQMMEPVYLVAEELERTNFERFERYAQIKATEQMCEQVDCDDADIIVVAFGASSRIARTAVRYAREEGIKVGLFRPITLWPFPADALSATCDHAKAFLSVEMNMGQMVDDVRLVVNGRAPVDFYGRTGGVIPTPAEVLDKIRQINEGLGE